MPRYKTMKRDPQTQDFLKKIHRLDDYVMGPTTLIKFDDTAKGSRGFFANTQDELYRKMAIGESEVEKLYDILDSSELCRYVSTHNYKCYALFMPIQLFNHLQGELNNG